MAYFIPSIERILSLMWVVRDIFERPNDKVPNVHSTAEAVESRKQADISRSVSVTFPHLTGTGCADKLTVNKQTIPVRTITTIFLVVIAKNWFYKKYTA